MAHLPFQSGMYHPRPCVMVTTFKTRGENGYICETHKCEFVHPPFASPSYGTNCPVGNVEQNLASVADNLVMNDTRVNDYAVVLDTKINELTRDFDMNRTDREGIEEKFRALFARLDHLETVLRKKGIDVDRT